MSMQLEEYALIGDCETAALVGRDGSIDWLCWPRFDSDACFAALLGLPEHGHWRIAPETTGEVAIRRRYRGDTLILETEFESDAGAVRLVDFMPVRGAASDVVRLVIGLRGSVPMRLDLLLRFDYGHIAPWLQLHQDGAVAIVGPDLVILRTPVELECADRGIGAAFTVDAGQTVPFVLSYGASTADPPRPIDPERALAETEAWWREWSGRFRRPTEWRDAVMRSLITLKALTNRPTGGVVAAPTASLPERFGGPLNWDYRYCWLRDASFTLDALLQAGYHEEAGAWRDWLLRAVADSPDEMQIMYRLDGGRRMGEWEAAWLPGYEGSAPVRIGNAAARQRQLDVYGELLNALHLAAEAGIAMPAQAQRTQAGLVAHLQEIWRLPDRGLWESRGAGRQHTYSKVMAWVGIDRFLAVTGQHPMDTDALHRLRQHIHDDICRRGYDPALGSFVGHYGSYEVDASLLRLPLVGFLPVEDPRIRGTIETIERELMDDGLVRRYKQGFEDAEGRHGQGAFLACSFWMAQCLHRLGRHGDARALFERVLARRSELGLLSEEYDTGRRRLAGNFPLALSHVALVNAAFELTAGQAQGAAGACGSR